jgi:hypothetical protein
LSELRDKILSLKERLLDPFSVDGLEREFEELLRLMKGAKPDELAQVKEEFEEIRSLLMRNLEIISGGLKPILDRGQGGLFSRRV